MTSSGQDASAGPFIGDGRRQRSDGKQERKGKRGAQIQEGGSKRNRKIQESIREFTGCTALARRVAAVMNIFSVGRIGGLRVKGKELELGLRSGCGFGCGFGSIISSFEHHVCVGQRERKKKLLNVTAS